MAWLLAAFSAGSQPWVDGGIGKLLSFRFPSSDTVGRTPSPIGIYQELCDEENVVCVHEHLWVAALRFICEKRFAIVEKDSLHYGLNQTGWSWNHGRVHSVVAKLAA